jgi:hypothetical protein
MSIRIQFCGANASQHEIIQELLGFKQVVQEKGVEQVILFTTANDALFDTTSLYTDLVGMRRCYLIYLWCHNFLALSNNRMSTSDFIHQYKVETEKRKQSLSQQYETKETEVNIIIIL